MVEVSKKIIPLVQRWYPEVTVQSDGVVDTIGHQNYERFDFNIPSGTLMLRQFEEHGEIPKCRRLMRVPQNAKEKLLPANIANKRIVLGVSWRSHLITDARIGNYMSVHSILRLLELLPDDIGLVCHSTPYAMMSVNYSNPMRMCTYQIMIFLKRSIPTLFMRGSAISFSPLAR